MKKGVSLLIVSVAIVVMLILVSSASIIGSNAINSANFEEYTNVLARVNNLVNEYVVENNALPVTNEIVSKESLGNEFLNQVDENGDLENDFYVVDMSKINVPTIELGNGSVAGKDVFIVAANSNNVYYMMGFKYKGRTYYIAK